jgi:ribosomal protein S18 acetylase RimI-like enzyme
MSLKLINLRNAKPDDGLFIFELTKATMRDYAIETWGDWHESETKTKSFELAQTGAAKIIELNKSPVGVLTVTTQGKEVFVEQLYILPDYQNQGIGQSVLQNFIDSLPINHEISLSVLKVNPAYKFYKGLGFQDTRSEPDRIYMTYKRT